jgi:hypothetical protein
VELVVLFVVLALLLFGPRRHGGMPGPVATIGGALFLIWFVVATLLGWSWRALFGTIPQP